MKNLYLLLITFQILGISIKSNAQKFIRDDSLILVLVSKDITGKYIHPDPYQIDFTNIITIDLREFFTPQELSDLYSRYPYLEDDRIDSTTIRSCRWENGELADKVVLPDKLSKKEVKNILSATTYTNIDSIYNELVLMTTDKCVYRKNITYLSRPAYNKSKTLCIIYATENDICKSGRIERRILYGKRSEKWEKIDIPLSFLIEY